MAEANPLDRAHHEGNDARTSNKRQRGHSSILSDFPFWRRTRRSDSVAAVIVDHRSISYRHSSTNPAYEAEQFRQLLEVNRLNHQSLPRPAQKRLHSEKALGEETQRDIIGDAPHQAEGFDGIGGEPPALRQQSERRSAQFVFSVMRDTQRAVSGVFGKGRHERLDSLDELEFDQKPRTQFKYPLLDSLAPRALKQFKVELEAAEDMRLSFNAERIGRNQAPQPEPRQLITKRLWSAVFMHMRKTNPGLGHFLDATFEDMQTWLSRALVPLPNNRPFMKKLELDLKQAWAESYFFGVPRSLFCFPTGGGSRSQCDDDEGGDVLWGLPPDEDLAGKDDKPVDPKKLSTTSTISLWSYRSRGSLPDVMEDVAEEQPIRKHNFEEVMIGNDDENGEEEKYAEPLTREEIRKYSMTIEA